VTARLLALLAALALAAPSPHAADSTPVPRPLAAPKPNLRQLKPLAPPRKAGDSAFRVSGCLTAAGEEEARRFETAPTRAAPAEPEVRVEPVQGGVVVVHELTHACCLKAAVRSRRDGDAFVVVETLSGAACRCQCTATIRTAVAVPPGSHPLAVELDAGGSVRRVWEGRATARGRNDEARPPRGNRAPAATRPSP
jgi:hypothetical protein